MNKIIMFLFISFITLPSMAVSINATTKREWNVITIVAALHKSGLHPYKNYNLISTYHNILSNLLRQDTFSVTDAVKICAKYCVKCSNMCKKFGENLVRVNNEGTMSLILDKFERETEYDSLGYIYTNDKKFYTVKNRQNPSCNRDLYETKTGKKIAVCNTKDFDTTGNQSVIFFKALDQKYNNYNFMEICEYAYLKYEGSCTLNYSKQ